jgi:hypothetical protein
MRKKKRAVISAFTLEANLKRKVRSHLRKLGFARSPEGALKPPSSAKEGIRALHQEQRKARLRSEQVFVLSALPNLIKHFADGSEIDPENVRPKLELIEADTWQSDLFRLASLSWSVPVSAGYGRRLRYLVWDASNNKLIGIVALGDPVFNLKVRDELINWDVRDRGKRLVNILDAYVLGAVPPYNMLLGGKLLACLMRTKDVRDDFARKYGNSRGIISGRRKRAQLVMVTTTSALGKSSVYNRLKLGGQSYLQSIGYRVAHFAHRPGQGSEECELFYSADAIQHPWPSLPGTGGDPARDGPSIPPLTLSIELEQETLVRGNRLREWGLRLTIPKSDDAHGRVSINCGGNTVRTVALSKLFLSSVTYPVDPEAADFGAVWISPEVRPRFRDAIEGRIPGLDHERINVFAASTQKYKPLCSYLSWGETYYFVWRSENRVALPRSLFTRRLADRGAWAASMFGRHRAHDRPREVIY